MIEVKHLKTLQALRNCGSLAAAAATLHQTQSALSHQFSDLEQRLGFRLFVRKSQPLRFTPQGEILLQLANQVLPQISQALQACNEPQQTRLTNKGISITFIIPKTYTLRVCVDASTHSCRASYCNISFSRMELLQS